MTIRDKVAVITGSGGVGSGRAMALRFAREGARVVVSDFNDEGGRETVRQVEAAGGQAAYFRADVRLEEDVRRLIAFAEKTFGGVAALVNNASALLPPGGPFDNWGDTVQTDFLGAMYGTRLAIDAMRRGGGGAIVNISSTSALGHGRTKSGGSAIYDAAKAGILRLTTGLAWLGAKEGIRVNCFVPHWIETPEVAEFYYSASPEVRAAYGAPGRLLPLEWVAGAVLRLVEDDSLAGRLLVWWSDEDEPRLIPWGDPGFAGLT